jgi:hypothetical protein
MCKLGAVGFSALLVVGCLQLSFVVSGCATSGETARVRPTTTSDLVQLLEEEGLSLFRTGVPSDVTFTVPGQEYDVSRGGTLQIYEYPREDEASLDAMRTGGGMRSNVRVFQSGTLVAIYHGDNLTVQNALARLLGPQM